MSLRICLDETDVAGTRLLAEPTGSLDQHARYIDADDRTRRTYMLGKRKCGLAAAVSDIENALPGLNRRSVDRAVAERSDLPVDALVLLEPALAGLTIPFID